jgi:predicted signal transduction protein with EAL and GGDEF domain
MRRCDCPWADDASDRTHSRHTRGRAPRRGTAGLRSEDLIARWGGEEFVAIFVGADLDEAGDGLNRVRSSLAAHLEKAQTPRFTSSFGLAHSSDHHGIDELIRAADVALYRAKENGRDQVIAHAPIRTSQVPERRLPEMVTSNFDSTPAEADAHRM